MLFEGVQLTGLILVRDSWQCDGTGVLLWTIQQLQCPAVFFSLSHNPAHYTAIFRKAGNRLNYIQGDSSWAQEVAEELLVPVVTWSEDTDRCELLPEALLQSVSETSAKVALVDDVSPLFYALEGDAGRVIQFINGLCSQFDCVIVRIPSHLSEVFTLLEVGCTAVVEVSPLATGYSRSVHGQLRIRIRRNFVLSETTNSFFRIADVGIIPAQLF